MDDFIQLLVKEGILTEEEGLRIGEHIIHTSISSVLYLLDEKIIESRLLAHYVAKYYHLPLYNLAEHDLSLIPKEMLHIPVVQKKIALPLMKEKDKLIVATITPDLVELSEAEKLLAISFEYRIVDAVALAEIIEALKASEEHLVKKKSDPDSFLRKKRSLFDEENNYFDSNSHFVTENTRFLDSVIRNAVSHRASDIHFEPYEKKFRIRYRKDGVLQEISSVSPTLASTLIARLKVIANLNISEHRVPQDGRFKMKIDKDKSIDIRISTCPTLHGEKAVLRILESSENVLNVDLLGFDEAQKNAFIRAAHSSQGMILVTGPTGSGKTVTLYTALSILNSIEKNISTIEDPIEIYMDGINQVQVNAKTGLTFSAALRAFLRQDPDIIMVGEIRDGETAEIAVKAAQTGHLVLSTLHTNSAVLAIQRLINIGIQPFDIVSSVIIIIAQRLVRKLCVYCKQAISEKEIKKKYRLYGCYDQIQAKTLYKASSCSYCNNGYSGRIGIFEVLSITDVVTEMILSKASIASIVAKLKQEGMMFLLDSGLDKVTRGETSLEELSRVINL